MNYMKQVADMLNVELGEEFDIGKLRYILTEEGLYCVEDQRACDHVLTNVLKGYMSIETIPWKPKECEKYWTIGRNGDIFQCTWYNDVIDVCCYKLGNCYKTGIEASENKDKWIQFYESDEVLEWS